MAHLYQMKDLQDDCEEYLQRNVTKENAVEAWTAAGVSGSQKLRDKALKTIARVIIYVNFCLQYSKAIAICQYVWIGQTATKFGRLSNSNFL